MKDMKYKVYLFLIAALTGSVMMTGCGGDEKTSESASLTIDKSEIEVMATGGITLININTSLAWNASADAEWVKINPSSGNGSGVVTVNIDDRGQGERRSATITFVAASSVQTVSVLQRGNLTDEYYRSGETIKLHSHSVGDGITVVIIGDGFDREDCKRGSVYEYNCRKLTDLFLSMPVIRDYTAYFDVVARVEVSRDRGARNCVNTPSNCPENAYNSGHPDLNWDKINEHATATAGKTDRSIIFMANGMIGGHVINDIAIYSANEPDKAYWMMHEFCGHVLGGLADMYYIYGNAPAQESTKEVFIHGHPNGDYLQFDWRKDPKEVYWKDFIGRAGYEQVGVWPAALWDLKLGELTTCEDIGNSVMFGPVAHYTVMERYQLWRKIQERAGFTTVTIDEFITYDVVNLVDVDWSWEQFEQWTDDRIWSGDGYIISEE
jgi:hypothetical protein